MRDHEKGNLIFSFATSPFFGQDYEKRKSLEVVTSLFELQNMFSKIAFLVWPFEAGNCGKATKYWIFQERPQFIIFEMLSFGNIYII